MSDRSAVRRLAMLVGGGPAPGLNGVISSVTIEAINNGIEVFGGTSVAMPATFIGLDPTFLGGIFVG